MSSLLTLYSSANSVFPMRRKAGMDAPGVIHQPSLTLFGTAIPNHYYEPLSERMLTNGFFARMIIFECGKRGSGQEPILRSLPSSVLETANWWNDFNSGKGNLESLNPTPKTVIHTPAAQKTLIEARLETEFEYSKWEEANDPVGTTVWGRSAEHIRKLALLYAVSETHRDPKIDKVCGRTDDSTAGLIDDADEQVRSLEPGLGKRQTPSSNSPRKLDD